MDNKNNQPKLNNRIAQSEWTDEQISQEMKRQWELVKDNPMYQSSRTKTSDSEDK